MPSAGELEVSMRPGTLIIVAVGWAVAVALAPLRGNCDDGATAQQIARLVKQLGDDAFAMREAASEELEAIGEPALDALRKAISADRDPEIRQRAERVIRAIARRAVKRELEKLQGTWSLVSYETDGKQIKGPDKSHIFTVTGDKWSIHVSGQLFQSGTVERVEAQEKVNAIDLLITEGGNLGATATSIYAVEGDSLRYLNCGTPRPKEFITKPGDGQHFLTFRRTKP